MKNIEKIDWEKMTDLIPVITQDSSSNEVLMLGYTNKEALEITIKLDMHTTLVEVSKEFGKKVKAQITLKK